MQIIGIYLDEADERVRKSLKANTWYPFGRFPNCHNFFSKGKITQENQKPMLTKIKENQNFINELYRLGDTKTAPTINLNCIVGKNGSGKSSLVTLQYRIINNLSCKIKYCLPNYNQDYHPTWSFGFNAELYYELESNIYCIQVKNNLINKEDDFFQEGCEYKLGSVELKFAEDEDLTQLFSFLEQDRDKGAVNEIKKKELKLLSKLSDTVFYSIATNYSLYPNSVVTDEWGGKEESWLNNLFHKNDGYFTPIVLVPYKKNGSNLDSKKELSLAKERVSTLSILTLAEKSKNKFIENFSPVQIVYSFISSDDYKKIMSEKLENLWKSFGFYNSEFPKSKIETEIKNLWTKHLFSANNIELYEKKWVKKSENYKPLFEEIKNNTLEYLTYKTIKICNYYDYYMHLFDNNFIQFQTCSEKNSSEWKGAKIAGKLIEDLICTNDINFMNLKIKQCISFLSNMDFYIGEKEYSELIGKNTIDIQSFIDKYCKDKSNINYDFIFKNLLPHFFKKEFYYSNNESNPGKDNRPLSSFSSGESQLFNSISYTIYHIKNASCIKKNKERINYNNINLVFDEAELYYHPEYQRTFISDLLGILKRSNLNKTVKSINITLITHSPFMLSDIPETNITYLKKGKIDETVTNKTLAANIYDLLKNQFFMDATIGKKSNKIIQEFLKDYKKSKKKIKEERIKFYESFIENIGDDYLHDTLSNMLMKLKNIDFKARMKKEFEEKIMYYQEQIKRMERNNEKN